MKAKTAKRKRTTRLPAAVQLPADVVRRVELANLRDEIFDYAIARIGRVYDEIKKSEQQIEAIQIAVKEMRGVVGLDRISPHARTLGEPVPWSYFHTWIARINERLETLERLTTEWPR